MTLQTRVPGDIIIKPPTLSSTTWESLNSNQFTSSLSSPDPPRTINCHPPTLGDAQFSCFILVHLTQYPPQLPTPPRVSKLTTRAIIIIIVVVPFFSWVATEQSLNSQPPQVAPLTHRRPRRERPARYSANNDSAVLAQQDAQRRVVPPANTHWIPIGATGHPSSLSCSRAATKTTQLISVIGETRLYHVETAKKNRRSFSEDPPLTVEPSSARKMKSIKLFHPQRTNEGTSSGDC